MLFSIIVPIFNTEKYLNACLDSIKNQTYKNFEVIMVNDGSTDSSNDIAKTYTKDSRFKILNKENGGLSDARNYGIDKSIGNYFLLIDSDDTIEPDLLKVLNDNIKNEDIIRFGMNLIEKNSLKKTHHPIFRNSNNGFSELVKSDIFESACVYCYNSNFYKENKFLFAKGKYHEDFGLIPYIVLKSKVTSSIDYYGYNYYKRENSITTSIDKDMIKARDILYHFENLLAFIKNDSLDLELKKLYESYVANVTINRAKELKGDNLNIYLKELKLRKIEKFLLRNSLKRYMKYLIIKYNIKSYIKRS